MPIYEYACRNCDHYMDALQKMSEEPLLDCPECGEPQLKRMISAPRFRLKGQGWYETDFKKDNQRNLSSGDGGVPATSDKSEPAKSAGSDKSSSSDTSSKSDSKKTESTPAKASTPATDGS